MDTVLLIMAGLCAVPAHAERHYHFVYELKTGTEAQSYCREKYTDLATIDNMEDVNTLINMAHTSNMVYSDGYHGLAWIGLYDDINSWRWSLSDTSFYKDGEMEFRRWHGGEPNNAHSKEHCTQMYDSGLWNDAPCEDQHKAVCSDVRGSDVTFILSNVSMTWAEAQSYCRANYTDLTSVRNMTENQKVQELIPAGEKVWIGLFRVPWKWLDGSNSSFRHWTPGEPQNNAGHEYCVAASFQNSGLWEDWPCNVKRPLICYSQSGGEQTTQQATTNQATTKQATTNQATTNQATTQQATTNQATTNQATTNQATTNQAMTNQATTNQATTKQATTKQATTNQATTNQATTNQATTKQATTNQATTKQATTNQATTNQATTKQATTNQATTKQATTNQATTKQATTNQATTKQATTNQATTKQATTKQATTNQATTKQATTNQATTKQATTKQATTNQATTKQATTNQASAKQATTKQTLTKPVTKQTTTKQVFRLKFETNDSSVDLNDPAVTERILKKIKQMLRDKGLDDNIKLRWRKQPDGKVFQKGEKKAKKKTEKDEL